MREVDAEDGFCPECGAMISAISIFDNVDDLDEEFDEEIDEEIDEEF